MVTANHASKNGNRSHGFTLMEVIIAITISGIIVVIIFVAFRLGSRAWEKGEKELEPNHRERVVLNLLQKQMGSICTRNIHLFGSKPHYLQGTSVAMEFLSDISLIHGNDVGIVQVIYQIEKNEKDNTESLVFREEPIAFKAVESNFEKKTDLENFIVLLENYDSIVFDYFEASPSSNETFWQEKWDPELKSTFPVAMRISFVRKKGDHPVTIVSYVNSKTEQR